ncbi:hypothetical protein F4804DRAFT_341112 [Jackrogersella minutella]|nr:hypothetical protein F4804DRAFT_341112 [Jackrogersella minutella]
MEASTTYLGSRSITESLRKGSPNRRPKITYPSSAQSSDNKLSHRAAEAVFRTPLPDQLIRERQRQQRQRRISRKKNGVRVSRRLPSRGTKASLGDDNQYSLMQVSEFTEDHPYWGTLRQSQIPNTKPKAVNAVNAAADESSRKGRAQVQATGHSGLPTPLSEQPSQKPVGRRQRAMSPSEQSRGRTREKRFGLADPVIWDAINRSLDQQRRLSTLVIPEDGMADDLQPSEIPSRTSSQHKALNRFTRQLEKYADAAGAARKPPVITPTESESKVSYHTVQQLLPYRKELRAAGLAVTSAEQSRGSPTKPKGNRMSTNHPPKVPVKPVQMISEFDDEDDDESEQSSSSSGSIVEFTPAGYPIELLPGSKPKSKQKSPFMKKGGLFPWLKRRPPAKETRGDQHKSKQTRPPVRDSRVHSQVKKIDSRNTRGLRSPQILKDLPSLPPNITTPPRSPRKLTRPSASISSPKRPSLKAPSSVEAKKHDSGSHSESGSSRPGLGLAARKSAAHTGLRKRDGAGPRPPRPATIEEEKENTPIHLDKPKAQKSLPPKPRDPPVPTRTVDQQPQDISPKTTPSSVPSLPYPARYASGRPSSLERALDEVSEQLDKMEQQTDRLTQLCSRRATTLVETTNQKETRSSSRQSSRKPSATTSLHLPSVTEEFIYVDRKMPPVKTPGPKLKKALPSPAPPEPSREPPTPIQERSLPSPPIDKTLPAIPQTQAILNDLDAFFAYDDADINDRDVIKGLQVAIHAAADNMYDVLIRDKTGLRIRRFLADLRAVGEMQQEEIFVLSAHNGHRQPLKFGSYNV